jgi:hypothetical protein
MLLFAGQAPSTLVHYTVPTEPKPNITSTYRKKPIRVIMSPFLVPKSNVSDLILTYEKKFQFNTLNYQNLVAIYLVLIFCQMMLQIEPNEMAKMRE